MKKRKFVAMTNEEYLERKGLCSFRNVKCPFQYRLEIHYRACGVPCKTVNDCEECWKLPAKLNGRYILKEVKKIDK